MEPPATGRLYYMAFLPNEKFRDRDSRLAQPWELHFARADGRSRATLTQIEEVWKEDKIRPELRPHHVPVASPEVLRKEIDARGPGLPVILVFAPPDLAYEELLRFVSPMLSTHGAIHVFQE